MTDVITALSASPLASTIAFTLLHFLWQGVVIAFLFSLSDLA